jgi:hypothetical protein
MERVYANLKCFFLFVAVKHYKHGLLIFTNRADAFDHETSTVQMPSIGATHLSHTPVATQFLKYGTSCDNHMLGNGRV